jgi:hypothetical protein
VDHAALVGENAVRADQRVAGDGVPESLDAEDVGDDVLSLAVDVRVDERDVVVAGNNVAEGGETLLHTLDDDVVGERIPEVEKLLVSRGGGYKQAVLVADGKAANDAGRSNRAVNNGNVLSKLGLENRVEVLGTSKRNQSVLREPSEKSEQRPEWMVGGEKIKDEGRKKKKPCWSAWRRRRCHWMPQTERGGPW